MFVAMSKYPGLEYEDGVERPQAVQVSRVEPAGGVLEAAASRSVARSPERLEASTGDDSKSAQMR